MDTDMTPRFAQFFEAVWQQPPFAWQLDLAERVLTNTAAPWPEVIALATAAGKTACIDIAVFALAAQAERLGSQQIITAPRRIFFVVDRRIIVDAAYQRARQLAAALEQPTAPIVAEVARRLRALALGSPLASAGPLPTVAPLPHQDQPDPVRPLAVFELRGGMYRSEAWARSPLQPLVVAATVDQFGSRLLFRAYGRGPGMRPVYAGLTGNDSLVLLDEAHCARPFLQTLRAVARYRQWGDAAPTVSFFPVVLSATPPKEDGPSLDLFVDRSDEPRDPSHVLGRRHMARKPTQLRLSTARGKLAVQALAKDLAAAALELATGPRQAVVVFANRVATARETYQLLAKRHPHDVILLTGRMRPLDRDEIIGERLQLLSSAAASHRVLERPCFVVATQTLEVGADLDFDALVSECASLDALCQRLGRLNRMGRPIAGLDPDGCPVGAEAIILVRADQAETGSHDPVYGDAIGATWQALSAWCHSGHALDFGSAHFDLDAIAPDGMEALTPPRTDAPVMLPSHLDAWVQTAPEPTPVPDIGLFLHGSEQAAADVRVCWRADLPEVVDATTKPAALELLTLCPPSAAESLPVPIGIMRRWLIAEGEDDSADIEGLGTADLPAADARTAMTRRAWLWRGQGNDAQPAAGIDVAQPNSLRPGDVLVLPGGAVDLHQAQRVRQLGDLPAAGEDSALRLDRGDEGHLRVRAKVLLRLHPVLLAQWPPCPAQQRLAALVEAAFKPSADEDSTGRFDDDPLGLALDLKAALSELAADPALAIPRWRWLKDAAAELAALDIRRLRRGLLRHPVAGLILRGDRLLPAYAGQAETFSDETEATASGTVAVPLLPSPAETAQAADGWPDRIRAHLPGVACYARRHAQGCQLSPALVAALEQAGLLHDLGKADPRFQALLHGGNPWIRTDLLAKSGDIPQGRAAYEQARQLAGYPRGARHELLSVRLAESATGALLPPANDPDRGLILHLIASHHGHCRPFAPVVDDPAGVAVRIGIAGHELAFDGPSGLERLDAGIPERFWQQVRRFGWWGSAWLEALLRLADHRRSEAEQLSRPARG